MMFYFFVLICKIFLFNQLIVNIADGAKSLSTTVMNNSTKSIDLFGADGKFSNYSLASDEQRKQILAIDVNKKFTVAQKQAEFDKILTIIEKDLHTKLAAIEHGDADISDDDDDGKFDEKYSGKYYKPNNLFIFF
jgi:hypothetical protein